MAKVKDFMSSDVVSVGSTAQVIDAARMMRDSDVGMLPVIDGGKLKGVITDRDLVVRALAEGRADATIGSILSEGAVCLSPDDDAKDAERLMSEKEVRRLPVVMGETVVGIVSVGDLAVRTDEKHAGKVMQETGPER